MRCLECGYLNDDSVSHCTKCGTLLMPSSKIKNTPTPEAPVNKPVSETPEIRVSGHPTVKGTPTNMPAWDAPETYGPKTVKNQTYFTCDSCNYYPLKEAISAENPCPNCGNGNTATANEVKSENKSSSTIKLSDIRMGEPEWVITLKEEGGEKSLSSDNGSLLVHRDNLDASNKALSSEKHARISVENGEVFLEDESSNQATFIQVTGKVKLENGTRVILGNKIYQITLQEK